MRFSYHTQGVCAQNVSFDLEDGKVSGVEFLGGCNDNLKAIARLVEGKDAAEIAAILAGNTCGSKPTSCGDQLSKALTEAIKYAAEHPQA